MGIVANGLLSRHGRAHRLFELAALLAAWPLAALWSLVAALLFVVPAAAGEAIVGVAEVVDGDTVRIGEVRVRLYGIDAPERDQVCSIEKKTYLCGRAAVSALQTRIAKRPLRCEERGKDRYRRTLAVCYLGREDLNAWLVRQGWALAFVRYASDYVAEEAAARREKLGLWRGEFDAPWDWRAAHRNGGARAGRAARQGSVAPPALAGGNLQARERS